MTSSPDVLEHRHTPFLRTDRPTLFDQPINGPREYFLVATANRDFSKATLDLVIDPYNGEQLLPNRDGD